MELSLLAVILGFILDLIVGDPHWLYHPIRLVGHLISGLEKLLRSIFPKTEQGELIAGGFLLRLHPVGRYREYNSLSCKKSLFLLK